MATVQTNHPLPAAPGQGQQYQQYQQYPQQPQQLSRHTRPRSKSGFSFRSHKSQESTGSAPKIDLRETSEEKQSQRLHTKADPLLAMSEAEPCEFPIFQQNCYHLYLRDHWLISNCSCHCDQHGSKSSPSSCDSTQRWQRPAHRFVLLLSTIDAWPELTIQFAADPDRSNPTRSRWERPLDTIRSFEAAIDGNYSRKSYMRSGEFSLKRQHQQVIENTDDILQSQQIL